MDASLTLVNVSNVWPHEEQTLQSSQFFTDLRSCSRSSRIHQNGLEEELRVDSEQAAHPFAPEKRHRYRPAPNISFHLFEHV
jgi:hypothetical protein